MSITRLLTPVLLGTVVMTGTIQAQRASPRIRAVQIDRQGSVAVVTVEASGPLPVPSVGRVEGPSRIFFDFTDVLPATRGVVSPGDPAIRGVRVALHSATPRVTRVVIDLRAAEPARLDADHLAAGRLRVFVGEVEGPGAPPIPPPPTPAPVPAPAVPIPGQPAPTSGGTPPQPSPPSALPPASPPAATPPAVSAPATPARDGDRYRAQIADAFARLLALRPLLATIDQFASPPPDELQMGAEEFDRIRRVISNVQPPSSMRSTHDLLVRACALGTMSARLRAEANRTSDIGQVRNAGSAAAGARLLLERVCVELGCDAK
jgi:hypothetical protein